MWAWFRSLLAPERPAEAIPGFSDQEARAIGEFTRHYHITFNHPELLKLALTHRSYLSVTGQGPRESNERLEFLGDSVLGLVTSEFLYREHPNEHEGQLTKTKSLLVSKAILSRRALAMGLGRFVLMSHSEVESGGRQRLSILADAFESVVGAIYLDQGFEAARAFIERWLLRDSREISADKRHTNYKSQLQEYVQSTFRTHPVYRIRSEMGPDHSKMFMVEVAVGRRALGEGKGHNKKEAEQAAARDALERVSAGGREREREAPHERERAPSRERERARAPEPEAEPEAEVAAEPEAGFGEEEAAEDVRRRRRGRRGGRGRRRPESFTGSEAPAAESGAPPAPELEEPEAPAPPRARAEGAPRRRAAEPPPRPRPAPRAAPRAEEIEPRPPRDLDEEEIGRPEGPLEERHIDPFEIEESPGYGGRSTRIPGGFSPAPEPQESTEPGGEPESEAPFEADEGPRPPRSFGRRPGRPKRSR